MEVTKLAFTAPEINPINRKAKSIPILNPVDRYGRVFFFSWFGFLVAFLSWYAFPPLLSVTIKKDLHMTQDEVANSNIVALLGTLLMRFIAGPLCDRFGPRYVFVGCLLCGAVPTAMAGLVTSPRGLIALRFFIGILGATFVPCQVWCTGFFDKNVVGTANALAGGLGNAGGGITYFVMPAIFDSLVSRGLAPHRAWRVAYIVPFAIIVAVALAMLFLCDDTPNGKWSQRDEGIVVQSTIVDLESTRPNTPSSNDLLPEKKGLSTPQIIDTEAQPAFTIPLSETVQEPTLTAALTVALSPATLALALPYACSFGAELAINSVLGAYYLHNFPSLGQTNSGRWAAMFGLVNAVFRPAGGFFADLIYRSTKSVWGKKVWLVCLGMGMGGAALAVGLLNPRSEGLMFGLVVLMAFFIAAGNGANFAIVPHVHPSSNGIVSGFVGGMGNFGGIVFAIVFRYNGVRYDRALWIIGVVVTGVNLSVAWIRPVPRHL